MDYSSKKVIDQVNVSTPERKKEYTKRWIEENPLLDAPLDYNESTSDVHFTPPRHSRNELLKITPPQSPDLKEKRSASSPIFGGKSFKRIKLTSKIAKFDEEKPSCSKTILKREKDLNLEKNDDRYFLKKPKLAKFQDSFNISTTSEDDKIHNNSRKIYCLTQFIESVSSDNNTEVTEFQVQEAASDTDKTVSDLIEDLSTQFNLESPEKSKHAIQSQKVSTPSTTSSEQTMAGHITDYTDTQCMEILTPMDQIDSISTLESKGETSKQSYILPYTSGKPQKKKKPKKGSLLELLQNTMSDVRSNVNLLRYQLKQKYPTVTGLPFVLLKILHYLPNFNGKQLMQCSLIEDTANLMKHFVKRKKDTITVMITPELSDMININQKPVLKVFEPWTIMDSKQLLIHITKFIQNQSSIENLSFCNEDKKALKLIEEFPCPCIDKNAISDECKTKFKDCEKSSVKIVVNYKS